MFRRAVRNGVRIACISGEPAHVREAVRQHPDRFIGEYHADPTDIMAAVRGLQEHVEKYGFKVLRIEPFMWRKPPTDACYYPLYAKCIELDIPVNIHSSINFSTQTLMEYGRPQLLDEVMVHLPELRVCAAPPGWPWVHELIGVAWRHRNVHIGLVAVRPKYLQQQASGYEGLVQFGGSVLQDRIIFGTSYPLVPVERSVKEVEELPLKDDVKRKWLHDNAARLLRLC